MGPAKFGVHSSPLAICRRSQSWALKSSLRPNWLFVRASRVSSVLLGSNNAEWASVVPIDGCIVQKTHLKPKRKKKKLSFATVGQMPRPGARWTGLLPNFRGSLKVNIFRGRKGLVAA